MKRARAVIARVPGLVETLASDPRRAAMFCARFGVAEEQILEGVPEAPGPTDALDEASFAPLRAVYT